MMRLEIRTQMPQVQLDIVLPKVALEQRLPQVHIDQELPTVSIDQSAPLGEIGLKSSLALARSERDAAQDDGYKAIATYASEGDQYMQVDQGVTVIDVVKERTDPQIPELNVTAIPKTRPEIEVTGDLSLRVEQGSVQARPELGSVDVLLQSGSVEVSTKDVPRMGETIDIRI